MRSALISGPRIGQDLSRVGAGGSRGPNQRRKYDAAPWSGTWPAPGSTLDLDFANNRGWVRGVGQGGVMDAITFTRASTGQYIDSTGTLVSAANNTPRFDWASTAQVAQRNLLTGTEAFTTGWALSLSTLTKTVGNAPDGSDSYLHIANNGTLIGAAASTQGMLYYNAVAGSISNGYCHSVYVKSAGNRYFCFATTGYSARAYFDLQAGTVYSNSWNVGQWPDPPKPGIESIGNGWYRCYLYKKPGSSNVQVYVFSTNNPVPNPTADGINGVYLWRPQSEYNSTPTTYQAIAQTTTNTPLAANPTCNGILIEEQRANRILWCRNATQSGSWTCTNVTPLLDQTGIDGVANAASSLTASADGGTCIQTITLAFGSRTGSVYLKRLTGTGNVQVSLDGSTWSTVDLSSTEWRRIVLSGTVTNPVVGIKLATNGDAVAMDFAQVEDNAGASSPILTTIASATRSADVQFIIRQPIFSNRMTFLIDADVVFENGTTGYAVFLAVSTADNSIYTPIATLDARSSVGFTAPSAVGFTDANTSPFSVKVAQSLFGGGSTTAALLGPRFGAVNGVSYNSIVDFRPLYNYDRISLGLIYRNTTTGSWINGRVRRVVVWPKILSTSAVEELTK